MEILPEYLLLHSCYTYELLRKIFNSDIFRFFSAEFIPNQESNFFNIQIFQNEESIYVLCIFTANRTLIVESNCLQNGSWTPVEFNCVPNEDQIRRHGNKR